MAFPKPKRLTSWSFSRWGQYEKCPLAAKFKFIDKLPEPGSDAMARGDAIHKAANAYIMGQSARLPAELKAHGDYFRELRKRYKAYTSGSRAARLIETEQTWAFRSDWTLTTWDDWNGCWLRIKTDIAYMEAVHDPTLGQINTLYVDDLKTGKKRDEMIEDYMKQLELYAVGGLVQHAGVVHHVIPRLVFVDYDPANAIVVGPTYNRSDIPRLQKEWGRRTAKMLKDETFKPRAGDHCRWCHFSKAKGGQCKF